jgi:hypothetical protein
MKPIITVENLSKRYEIGAQQPTARKISLTHFARR